MEQLSFHALPVLSWLFESSIYTSILICLIFIIKAFTKRRLPAWWSYCLWLLLLVRMLIPIVVETPVGVFNYFPAPPENSSYMSYLVQHKINTPSIQNVPVFSPDAVPADTDLSDRPLNEQQDSHESAATDTSDLNLSLNEALLLLWLAGVLAFGIATVYKNCKFRLTLRREQPVTDKDILDLFNECRSTLGLQKKVEIIVTGSVKSPAIYGYFKPQLLLPVHFLDTLTKDELYCIFLHELGHVKRHDIGVSWLATLFQVIYWFNPLVWYAFHYLRADQEAACDAYVLSKIKKAQPTDYARTIVNLLKRFVQNRQLPSLAGIIENKSQIGRRISMILDYKKITQKMTLVSVLMLFIAAFVFFSFSNGRLAAAVRRPNRTVAITIDDLPAQRGNHHRVAMISTQLLLQFADEEVSVTGFVNTAKLDGYSRDEAIALLAPWLTAGHELGNHTHSHPDFNSTNFESYIGGIRTTDEILDSLLGDQGLQLRYFRHPMLHSGETPAQRDSLNAWLSEHGYIVAPVTIDNSDYIFGWVYEKALEAGDSALALRIVEAYLDHMEACFDHFEQLSREAFGREPAQILLIHANRLTADTFGRLAARIRERGYRFITLEKALQDELYTHPEATSRRGLSWIHQWRLKDGFPMVDDPEPPEWVMELFNQK